MVNFTTVACRISSWLKWCKNYKNQLRLAEVIVKNKMSRFLWFTVYNTHTHNLWVNLNQQPLLHMWELIRLLYGSWLSHTIQQRTVPTIFPLSLPSIITALNNCMGVAYQIYIQIAHTSWIKYLSREFRVEGNSRTNSPSSLANSDNILTKCSRLLQFTTQQICTRDVLCISIDKCLWYTYIKHE